MTYKSAAAAKDTQLVLSSELLHSHDQNHSTRGIERANSRVIVSRTPSINGIGLSGKQDSLSSPAPAARSPSQASILSYAGSAKFSNTSEKLDVNDASSPSAQVMRAPSFTREGSNNMMTKAPSFNRDGSNNNMVTRAPSFTREGSTKSFMGLHSLKKSPSIMSANGSVDYNRHNGTFYASVGVLPSLAASAMEGVQHTENIASLNSADLFFTSKRVAKEYEHLPEAQMILSFTISYPPKLGYSKQSEYSVRSPNTKHLYNRSRFEDGDMYPSEELKEGSINSNASNNDPREVQVFKPYTWGSVCGSIRGAAIQLQKSIVRLILQSTDLIPAYARDVALHTVLIVIFSLIYLFFCLFTSNYVLIFIIISAIIGLVYLGYSLGSHMTVRAQRKAEQRVADVNSDVTIGAKLTSSNRFSFSMYGNTSNHVADSGISTDYVVENESAVIDIGDVDEAISKFDESDMFSIASGTNTSNPSTRRTVVRRRTTVSVSTEELGSDDSDDDGDDDDDEDDDEDDDGGDISTKFKIINKKTEHIHPIVEEESEDVSSESEYDSDDDDDLSDDDSSDEEDD